jgi:hypothetical protein
MMQRTNGNGDLKLLEYHLTFGKRYGAGKGGTPDYLTARKLRMEAKRKRNRTLRTLCLKKADSIGCLRDTEMLYKRVDLSAKEVEAQGGYEIRPRFYPNVRAEDGDELRKTQSLTFLPSFTDKPKEPPFGVPVHMLLQTMALQLHKPVKRNLEYSGSEDSFTLDYTIPRELR